MGNKLDNLIIKQHQQQQQQQNYYHLPQNISRQQHKQQHRPSQQYSVQQTSAHQKPNSQQQVHSLLLNKLQQQTNNKQQNQRLKKSKNRLTSCPDLLKDQQISFQDNKIQTPIREERQVDIKIYRSYTDLYGNKNRSPWKHSEGDKLSNIKIYRKSQERLNRASSYAAGVNNHVPFSFHENDLSFYDNQYGTSYLSNSMKSMLSIATTSVVTDPHRPPSRRSLSRCSNSGSGIVLNKVPLNVEDFPSEEVVRRKCQTFEHFLCNFIVKNFKQMPLLDQMASLSILHLPDRANQSLSLLHYFRTKNLLFSSSSSVSDHLTFFLCDDRSLLPSPTSFHGDQHRLHQQVQHILDNNSNNVFSNSFLDNNTSFFPTLPNHLCLEVDQLKVSLGNENHAVLCLDLLERIINFLSKQSSSELSRIFEYQLSLINENIGLRLLARNACNNIFEIVKSRSRLLDVNTMVTSAMGCLSGRKNEPALNPAPKWISVVIGNKELKWNIYEIMKKPALRKDNFCSTGFYSNSPQFSPSSLTMRSPSPTPSPFSTSISSSSDWKFFTSSECEPMLYGYRAQVFEKSYLDNSYRPWPAEESKFTEELPWRYDDIHRLYSPYYRVVGDCLLKQFSLWLKNHDDPLLCDENSSRYKFEDFSEETPNMSSVNVKGSCATPNTPSNLSQGSISLNLKSLEDYMRKKRSGCHVRQSICLLYKPLVSSQHEKMENCQEDVNFLKDLLLEQQGKRYSFSTAKPYSSSSTETQTTTITQYQHQPTFQLSYQTSYQHLQFNSVQHNSSHLNQQIQQQKTNFSQKPQNQSSSNVISDCQGDEMLSRALAQVTMQCDQLCSNLKQIN